MQGLVAIPVVLGRGDHGDDRKSRGLEDRDGAVESGPRVTAIRVVVGQGEASPERLADDDVAAGPHRRRKRLYGVGQASVHEARTEAERGVVLLVRELLTGRVGEPERDEVRETARLCPLDRGGVELGRDLDSFDSALESLREQERRPAPARGDVEHTRARPEPNPLAEQEKLVLGRRILDLVVPLRDDEVTRNHRADSPRCLIENSRSSIR